MICSSVVNSVDLRKSENGFRFGAKTAAEKSVAMTIMVIFATCGLKNSWIVMARKVATNAVHAARNFSHGLAETYAVFIFRRIVRAAHAPHLLIVLARRRAFDKCDAGR